MRNTTRTTEVMRPLELLVGMRAIARFLHISNRRVLAIEKMGAPLVRDEGGVLRAEKAELWGWWRGYSSGRSSSASFCPAK